MKKVLFTAIVLIVLGIAWVWYLRWGTTRFVKDLPKAPTQTKIEYRLDMIAPESPGENEARERPSTLENDPVSTNDRSDGSEDIPGATGPRPPHHSKSHSGDSRIAFEHEQHQVDLVESDEGSKEDKENPSRTFRDLSVEQIIENNRRYFINKYGNIPEIDIYLKLNAPFYKALKDGKTKVAIERTAEESLELRRVTAVLFPSEENKRAYQEELRRMKEAGMIE